MEQMQKKKRMLVVAGCVLVLLFHIWVPLRYYIFTVDRADERFRWRMFSTVRMQRCRIEVTERQLMSNGVELDLKVDMMRKVQMAWVNLMKRGRPAVIEGVLHFRCGEKGVKRVHVVRRCLDVTGKPLFQDTFVRDCKRETTVRDRQMLAGR
ncbi:MAG: hypothetical protein AAGJ35_01745 [Myxococcota bacterium]